MQNAQFICASRTSFPGQAARKRSGWFFAGPTFLATLLVLSIPLTAGAALAGAANTGAALTAPPIQDQQAEQPQIPEEAAAVAQTAANAQNAKDYTLAASQWEKLIASWPNCALAPTAHYNAGVCYFQQQDYEKAVEQLGTALSKLGAEEVQKISLAHLYLGFSLARLGKQIQLDNADKNDEALKLKANELLTTSTNTFEMLLTRYPDFADADQACFFQGEAYELLERLDKAAESYARMKTCPQNNAFKFDGLFALGNVYEQQQQYDLALENYNEFRTEAEKLGGHDLLNEVDFRTGSTLLQLATAAAANGDNEAATGHYQRAAGIFAAVADVPGFNLADRARFQQAFCLARLGDHAGAAALYEQVAAMEGSDVAVVAAVEAGREYVNAGNSADAERLLVVAVSGNTDRSPAAAHQLARIYSQSNRHQLAYDVALAWIPQANDNLKIELMMDQADAAWQIPDKKNESADLYLKIANESPQHPLAPTALYNAAFSMLETKNIEKAIELADQFEKQFAENSFLPDAQEVKAEAKLAAGDPAAAGTIFRDLVRQHSDNVKSNAWALRIGLCEYMQKEYEKTIEWLEPAATQMTDKAMLAEALHWIGSSQFNLKQNDAAITALLQSNNTDNRWLRADETLLTLSRALRAAGRTDEADKATQNLIAGFPQSPFVAEAIYRTGEQAYGKGEFEVALTNFENVITNHNESDFVPLAMYDSAWASLKLEKFDEATKLFARLIDDFPNHELATRSRIGRGASLRAGGNAEEAIRDFDAFLAGEISDQARQEALYEKGLALIDLKNWPEVKATFEDLLAKNAESPLADRYHYEIAWAARGMDDEPVAIEHFTAITEKFAASPLAPEANFHKANALYNEEKYDEAAAAYELCLNSGASDSLREKSAYKLAWCYYKNEDFAGARDRFATQATSFPQGELFADAKVMVSESLYRLEDHEGAYAAYVEALPVVEASQTVDARVRWQTLLHGGQSANKANHFTEAINFVQPIVDSTTTTDQMKQEAWLEIGYAKNGLNEVDAAVHAWEQAAENRGDTGAEARCMIGEALYGMEQFDDAINAYKLVFYGYGGLGSEDEEIRKWQAFAVFEAAQCNFVQVAEAEPRMKTKLADEAIRLFNYLIENYETQDARLTEQAKQQLERLNAMKNGSQ